MKNSCRRGYRKVGDSCRKIKKKLISKKEGNNFISILFGFATYSLIGKPLEVLIDNTIASNVLRVILGLVAFGMFYYFFQND